ncbi:hypothetical protein IWQ55_005325 [Labrenzia sp. EL_208]|nr:hypothetical protein [Labrenzia sp. EL_132]MBG6232093.1 hypothetical protein [Labrenzia sp. EL_208]
MGNLMAALVSVAAQGQFKWEGIEFQIDRNKSSLSPAEYFILISCNTWKT